MTFRDGVKIGIAVGLGWEIAKFSTGVLYKILLRLIDGRELQKAVGKYHAEIDENPDKVKNVIGFR